MYIVPLTNSQEIRRKRYAVYVSKDIISNVLSVKYY